jgi:hypothetical protein
MTAEELRSLYQKRYNDFVVEYHESNSMTNIDSPDSILFLATKNNVRMLIWVFVSKIYATITDLDLIIVFLTSYLKKNKFHCGKIEFVTLNEKSDVEGIYTLNFNSKYILRAFSRHDETDNTEKWGFGSPEGINGIEPFYENVSEFKYGLAAVQLKKKWGYVNDLGQVVVPFDFEEVGTYSEYFSYPEVSYYEFNNTWVNRIFQTPPKLKQVYAPVKKDGKWGYINRQGQIVIGCIYEDAGPFSGGYAHVKKDGKWGYIDGKGNKKVSFIYDDAKPICDMELAPVKKGNKWGFVNPNNDELVIPPSYDFVLSFKFSRYSIVSKEGRWGYINAYESMFDRYKNRVTRLIYDSLEDALDQTLFIEIAQKNSNDR